MPFRSETKKADMPPFLLGIEFSGTASDLLPRYPFNLPWLPPLTLSFSSRVTILVGENGSGKSTLIKVLADAAGLPGGGGTKNELADNHIVEPAAELRGCVRVRFRARPARGFYYRADTGRTFADLLDKRRADPDFWGDPYAAYGGTSLHVRSSGQGALARFRAATPPSLVLLDEPENGLSVVSQLALARLIGQWVSAGSQVIMATHSVILMAVPQATLIDFDDSSLPKIRRDMTTHWTVARRVLLDDDFLAKVADDAGE